jgi:hypothetical protein
MMTTQDETADHADHADSTDEVEVPDGPAAARVIPWLRCNLGREVTAMLTNGDADAIMAAAQVAELYQRVRQDRQSLASMRGFLGPDAADAAKHLSGCVAEAFYACVMAMQPKCREMAYHAIAMVDNWSARPTWWYEAGLEPIAKPMVCKYEPGGSKR